MKKLLTIITCFCFSMNVIAQTLPQKITSKIERVTVFTQGAQVFRTANVSLQRGKRTLIFEGISPNIDKQSIQVKAEGKLTILSVTSQLNFFNQQKKSAEITTLEQQRKRLQNQKRLESNSLAIFKKEEMMLSKNEVVSGTQTGLKATDLREVADFQRLRLMEVFSKQLEYEQKIANIDSVEQLVYRQLNILQQQSNLSTNEVSVMIDVAEAQTTNFELSYIVKAASWYPTYDLRVKDISNPMDLTMKANVTQRSGEDWKDIKLAVSNGNPSEKGNSPKLLPWFLRFGEPYSLSSLMMEDYSDPNKARIIEGYVTDKASGEPLIGASIVTSSGRGVTTDINGHYSFSGTASDREVIVSYVGYETETSSVRSGHANVQLDPGKTLMEEVVVVGYGKAKEEPNIRIRGKYDDQINMSVTGKIGDKLGIESRYGDVTGGKISIKTNAPQTTETYQPTTTTYEIKEPYTILNDGKDYVVEIKNLTLPCEYSYYAVPKLQKDVFLTAQLTDWQALNLFDGDVSLFFEGAYLGQSYLDLKHAQDTLNISLGKDKAVSIERTKVKDYSKRKFFSSNKVDARAYEIAIKNNKQQAIKVIIKDQFPLASSNDMSVESLEYNGAQLDEATNILTWQEDVPANKEKKLSMKYSVKYPKNKVLNLE